VRAVDPDNRTWWDAFCMVAVLASAFEIPYSLLVGYESVVLERWAEITFSSIFAIDILLNSLTIRDRNRYGLWGWRLFAGLVFRRLRKPRSQTVQEPLMSVGRTAAGYLTSGWFPIDLLATVPWGLLMPGASVIGASRLLRLLRLARLFRLTRILKLFRFMQKLKKVMPSLPSFQFLAAALIVIPWIAHIHACVMYFAESENPQSVIASYGDAMNAVFITFTTSDKAQTATALGYWTSVSAVVLSVLVVAAVTGTLAAAFTEFNVRSFKGKWTNWMDHTVILGWQGKICLPILQQLAISDEGGAARRTLIVTGEDPTEILSEIAASDRKINEKLMDVMHAEPSSRASLRAANLVRARQVIAVSTRDDDLISDSLLLRELLAIGVVLREAPPKERLTVIVAVGHSDSVDALRDGVPQELREHMDLHVVGIAQMATWCVAQIVRCPQLAPIIVDLMKYEGGKIGPLDSEVYCVPVEKQAVGRTFDDYGSLHRSALPIGYVADSGVVLNPPPEDKHGLRIGDRMLVIAADSDSTRPSSEAGLSAMRASGMGQQAENSKPIAVCVAEPTTRGSDEARDIYVMGAGVGDDLPVLLERMLPAGSQVRCDEGAGHEESACDCSDLSGVDTVVMLSQLKDRMTHDADVLMKLSRLLASGRLPLDSVTVIVDLLDSANAETVGMFGRPVIVAGMEMVCNLVIQLAEMPEREAVFRELLFPGKNSICIRSGSDYLRDADAGESLPFEQVRARARARHETAIGVVPDMTREPILCVSHRGRPVRRTDGVVVIAREG